MSVTHATVAADPQTPRLSDTDWNDNHVVLLDAADIGITVRAAAGVPAGAPTGTELPIAFDTTATTGGLYVWNGSAWVYAAPIPPVVTPD